jgi:DNA-binding NarL/FixJ family response regulator
VIRLLIADDHTIVREGLKQLFALAPDIQVVGEATCGDEVLERLHDNAVNLLLLDMNMPGLNGVDLIVKIKSHVAAPPILVLSMYNEPQIAARALNVGAKGYITKDSDPEKLLAAIKKVAAGGRYVDSALAEQIVFNTMDQEQSPHTQLSERELEVFRLLASGLSVNEIAERLSLSNKTISTHKLHLMEKMGFSNIADIVRYAIRHNFSG